MTAFSDEDGTEEKERGLVTALSDEEGTEIEGRLVTALSYEEATGEGATEEEGKALAALSDVLDETEENTLMAVLPDEEFTTLYATFLLGLS